MDICGYIYLRVWLKIGEAKQDKNEK